MKRIALGPVTRIRKIALLALALCTPSAVFAEKAEKLTTKRGEEFYGWQSSPNEFVTCRGKRMPVDGGTIVKTAVECPQRPPIDAAKQQGRISKVEKQASGAIVTLSTPQGAELKLFIPQANLGDASALTGLEGRSVTVQTRQKTIVESVK